MTKGRDVKKKKMMSVEEYKEGKGKGGIREAMRKKKI